MPTLLKLSPERQGARSRSNSPGRLDPERGTTPESAQRNSSSPGRTRALSEPAQPRRSSLACAHSPIEEPERKCEQSEQPADETLSPYRLSLSSSLSLGSALPSNNSGSIHSRSVSVAPSGGSRTPSRQQERQEHATREVGALVHALSEPQFMRASSEDMRQHLRRMDACDGLQPQAVAGMAEPDLACMTVPQLRTVLTALQRVRKQKADGVQHQLDAIGALALDQLKRQLPTLLPDHTSIVMKLADHPETLTDDELLLCESHAPLKPAFLSAQAQKKQADSELMKRRTTALRLAMACTERAEIPVAPAGANAQALNGYIDACVQALTKAAEAFETAERQWALQLVPLGSDVLRARKLFTPAVIDNIDLSLCTPQQRGALGEALARLGIRAPALYLESASVHQADRQRLRPCLEAFQQGRMGQGLRALAEERTRYAGNRKHAALVMDEFVKHLSPQDLQSYAVALDSNNVRQLMAVMREIAPKGLKVEGVGHVIEDSLKDLEALQAALARARKQPVPPTPTRARPAELASFAASPDVRAALRDALPLEVWRQGKEMAFFFRRGPVSTKAQEAFAKGLKALKREVVPASDEFWPKVVGNPTQRASLASVLYALKGGRCINPVIHSKHSPLRLFEDTVGLPVMSLATSPDIGIKIDTDTKGHHHVPFTIRLERITSVIPVQGQGHARQLLAPVPLEPDRNHAHFSGEFIIRQDGSYDVPTLRCDYDLTQPHWVLEPSELTASDISANQALFDRTARLVDAEKSTGYVEFSQKLNTVISLDPADARAKQAASELAQHLLDEKPVPLDSETVVALCAAMNGPGEELLIALAQARMDAMQSLATPMQFNPHARLKLAQLGGDAPVFVALAHYAGHERNSAPVAFKLAMDTVLDRPTAPQEAAREARKLANEYVDAQAPRQVKLDDDVRERILLAVTALETVSNRAPGERLITAMRSAFEAARLDITRSVFEAAQRQASMG